MRTVSVKQSVYARIFADRVVKSAINVSIGTIRAKSYLEFIKTFSNMERKFRLFVIFFSGLSKQQSTYPDEQFDEKQPFERRIMVWSFSDIERKISGRLAVAFRFSCQNCALDLRRKNWGKKWKSQLFRLFLVFERKFFGRLLFSHLVFVKLAFYVSMGLFRIKSFFEQKIFFFIIFAQRANGSCVLLELFRQGSENCFIRVQKNVLGGRVCGKSISSLTVFRHCAKTVGPSDKFLRQDGF